MTASTPTILATSGGLARGRRTLLAFGPLLHYAIELSGVSGRAPRVGYAGTAMGDQDAFAAQFTAAPPSMARSTKTISSRSARPCAATAAKAASTGRCSLASTRMPCPGRRWRPRRHRRGPDSADFATYGWSAPI